MRLILNRMDCILNPLQKTFDVVIVVLLSLSHIIYVWNEMKILIILLWLRWGGQEKYLNFYMQCCQTSWLKTFVLAIFLHCQMKTDSGSFFLWRLLISCERQNGLCFYKILSNWIVEYSNKITLIYSGNVKWCVKDVNRRNILWRTLKISGERT